MHCSITYPVSKAGLLHLCAACTCALVLMVAFCSKSIAYMVVDLQITLAIYTDEPDAVSATLSRAEMSGLLSTVFGEVEVQVCSLFLFLCGCVNSIL